LVFIRLPLSMELYARVSASLLLNYAG